VAGQLAVPRILWVALFISTLLYLVVIELTTLEGEPKWQGLLFPLAVAAVATAGASLVAPRILLRQRTAQSTEESSSTQAAGAYLVSLILSMALAEAVAILGLILGILGAPVTVVMPFFVVTWILMLLRFPTQEKLDEFRV
jgi:hypothetical protein